ncbi:hypothetical protein HC341_01245 [Aquisalimonas sp. 2447]|uniref:hypothetical protein n=1 Tax=Aquisalimonas sp. 2447 TaxID=2740807 RepID=UPI0014326E4E|nr:hypothetical protein [Aquisalimonas sp. 2447]QIT53960.1 hypothetical protein HC341_01245 [Aquisalimonas sp. 2447]
MYRMLVTCVWLIGFSATVFGASFAVVLLLIISDLGAESAALVDGFIVAAISVASIALAVGVRSVWPKFVFTREGYRQTVTGVGGLVWSKSRFSRAYFGDIEVGYCFPRDFIFFNLQWSPPRHSRFRRHIQSKIESSSGWISATYLWRIAENLVPLVIRIVPYRRHDRRIRDLRERLASESDGRVVETWIQRLRDGETKVCLLGDHSGVEPEPGDDVFVLVYVEPWRASIFERLIGVAAEFAEPRTDGKRLSGPGWPAKFY